MSKDTLTVNGITRKVWEWAKLTNIDYRVLKYRLRQKVPINELFIPQLKRGPKFRRKIGNPNALPYTWNKTSLGCYKQGCNCSNCMLVPEWFKKHLSDCIIRPDKCAALVHIDKIREEGSVPPPKEFKESLKNLIAKTAIE